MAEIVVGTDGSEVSMHAVAWAAKEAVLHGRTLRVVHALERWIYQMPDDAPFAHVGRWTRQSASDLLAEAGEHGRRAAPGVELTSELLPGDARTVLLHEASRASMLVVGGRGEGGFAGLLLGSVAHGVTGRAENPVAVIQGPLPEESREVVVGVDDSPGSRAAVELAFAEASARNVPLRAVYVWRRLTGIIAGDLAIGYPGPVAYDVHQDDEAARATLAAATARWSERYPEVKLIEQVEQGHPVEVLVKTSSRADVMFLGRRGRGGFPGLRLGSVSRGVLHYATCPVVFVPAPGGSAG